MTRRVSQIEAYKEILSQGLLPRRREEIYDWVFHHGPLNANQVARSLHRDRGATSCRCGELVDLGVFVEAGSHVCPLTNMTVLIYDVTDNLPVQNLKMTASPRRASRKDLVEEVKRLNRELDGLQERHDVVLEKTDAVKTQVYRLKVVCSCDDCIDEILGGL